MDVKERILQIAYDVFAEKGYEKAALGSIADQLGFTRPALYYHFQSKEDLFLAVYNTIDPIEGSDTEALVTTSTPEEFRVGLDRTLRNIVGHYRTDHKRAQFIMHVQHASSYLPSVIDAAKAQDARLRESFRLALIHGKELGAFGPAFNVENGVAFLALTVYGIGEVMLRGTEVDMDSVLTYMFDGLFAK